MTAVPAVAAAWLLAAASHTAGIPRTDDWAFSRVALTWARTGHLHLVGWGQMSLIGLLVWARPWMAVLGDHQWVLDLSASVLVVAGLAAAYRLARVIAGGPAAIVAVATVAAAPGFVRDAGTFMTDGPALAVSTIGLLAGFEAAGASGRRRWLLEAGCVAAGCWAFSIRELAIAGPLAVLAVRWLAEPRRRRPLGAGIAALGAFCVAFTSWRGRLAGGQPYDGRPPVFTITELVIGVVFTTCLFLVPVLAATAPRWWRPVRPTARAVGTAVGGLVAVLPVLYAPGSWTHRYQWLTGDYLDPRGINGDKLLIGSRPRLLPPLGWAGVEAVAVIAGVVVFGLVAEALAGIVSTRSRRGLHSWSAASLGVRVLVAHLAIVFGLLVVAIVVNGATFDRYLWPAVLSAGILLLGAFPLTPPSEWHPAALQVAVGVAAAFAVVSLLVTLDSDAFDGIRWRTAQEAVRAGVPAGRVDAGFEWSGYHAATVVADANASGDRQRPYWLAMVRAPAACVELTVSKQTDPGLSLIGVRRWRTWLVMGESTLYEYRRPAACPS